MTNNHYQLKSKFVKKNRREVDIEEIFQGILAGNRAMLAKGITLIESNARHHFDAAQALLQKVLPYTNKSVRIGISGVPGAGKSTFIERFGTDLCDSGHKVAVLAIDPSSSLTGGSILGDKTRMEKLSTNESAFIRPSPSEGTLGGVHRKTRESMLLCEAAGYDVILVETVGVGQSEAIVRGMTDFFMLLAITGAGDELQGMKKGIMELADAIVVNKADGDNKLPAQITQAEYNRILHFLQPATPGWQTKAYTISSMEGDGIQELWESIQEFVKQGKAMGVFAGRRKEQTKEWMQQSLSYQLHKLFFEDQHMLKLLPQLEQEVMNADKTVSAAVMEALQAFLKNMQKEG